MKETFFINRLKIAEHEKLCFCIEVCKKCDHNSLDGIFEVLSGNKIRKLKTRDILIENCKNMCECLDFEQEYYSKTAKSIYKSGDDSVRLIEWMA